ncbi:nicotinate-nucleotide--dimethylbenzimidazole phosphoribosyltransferase [Arcobacter sp. CECT 8985]|uniref:nicotinate-nucleotide--dimethylbenzimidazole phosphoribosyltransferase n=1 Tax=Arcobacter sp. CECT 8985 TaxID=1935424 RepID=UPI00100B9BFD|nr:nicotinate-nucleotide--dimethylbenzimidazole phosphoribosyltransferase [Arcobacter sp. CECT 8985]RXJ83520.1 nicotinate-nucleotide--dimethylbenzimidazole phosphoribosyltransferase [Arcobacter sp. CECT 8985]
MNFNTILGKKDFMEFLRGKKATFLLSCSVTKTADIEGISQAGIPGKMHLTPTLDAEFLAIKEVRSLDDIATTSKGIPTPGLITRAVHEIKPFENIEFLNLGFEVMPKIDYFKIHNFDIKPSNRIDESAKIDAMAIFQKGLEFGQNYKSSSKYTILAETIPAGTTTAKATAMALGYEECEEYFASSFKKTPNAIRDKVLKSALYKIDNSMDIFQKLSIVSDNMIVFNAGFILGLQSTNHKLVLAGGTQMAAVLLTVNSILKTMGGEIDSSKLALCTTKWIAEDENSNIEAILKSLDFKIAAYYAEFDFSTSKSEVLKLYDKGEAKEGVGAGGALVYAAINGASKGEIVKKVESFIGV